MNNAPRWRVVDPDALAWADWPDQHVLYHRPSGLTHFLNASSAVLLREVLIEPRGAREAAEMLANTLGAECTRELVESVAASLMRFEELGLVERVVGR